MSVRPHLALFDMSNVFISQKSIWYTTIRAKNQVVHPIRWKKSKCSFSPLRWCVPISRKETTRMLLIGRISFSHSLELVDCSVVPLNKRIRCLMHIKVEIFSFRTNHRWTFIIVVWFVSAPFGSSFFSGCTGLQHLSFGYSCYHSKCLDARNSSFK